MIKSKLGWNDISVNIGRPIISCFSKYIRLEDNKRKKITKWTDYDDELLRKLKYKYGNNTTLIFTLMGGKSISQINARWDCSVAPWIKHGKWNSNEDIACILGYKSIIKDTIKSENNNNKINLNQKYHFGVWKQINKYLPNRTHMKIRERYMNVLIKKNHSYKKFNIYEDKLLIKYQKIYGNNWSLISKLMNTQRTDCQVRQRFNTLMKHNNKNRKRKRNKI